MYPNQRVHGYMIYWSFEMICRPTQTERLLAVWKDKEIGMTEGQCLLLYGVEKSKPLYTRYGPFIIKSNKKLE